MWKGCSAAEARRRALALLDEVQMREPERVMRCYPHELSGGMRQRVLIAAAFALEPKLVIADEPTTALDVTVQKQILRLIRDMQLRHGTGAVFVTHDLGVVAQICDRVTLLYAGRVMEQGRRPTMLSPATPLHARPRRGEPPLRPARCRAATRAGRRPRRVPGRDRGLRPERAWLMASPTSRGPTPSQTRRRFQGSTTSRLRAGNGEPPAMLDRCSKPAVSPSATAPGDGRGRW